MKLVIEGGRPLRGEVAVQGAKNSALHLLAAALLTDEPIVLQRVPELSDVRAQLALLEALGKRVERLSAEGYRLRASPAGLRPLAPSEPARRLRASFHVLGPLLARCGEAAVPLPGGDAIGPRPVDLHLRGLEALGAHIEVDKGKGVVYARARAGALRPACIELPYPSVGATIHLMITAAGLPGPGRTVIENAAREPEVDDVARLLRAMGARVERTGSRLEIRGQDSTELRGAEHQVMPDRICAGTYAIAVAIAGGSAIIRCVPWHLGALVDTLQAMGVVVRERPDGRGLEVARGRGDALRAIAIETRPYPGFPTDLHPPIAALLALADGESRLRETVFEDRFAYVEGLRRLGAQIEVDAPRRTAIVRGGRALEGADVRVHKDNRAGAALVLAGLAARGTTIVHDDEGLIPRGYSRLVEDLRALGADIKQANDG